MKKNISNIFWVIALGHGGMSPAGYVTRGKRTPGIGDKSIDGERGIREGVFLRDLAKQLNNDLKGLPIGYEIINKDCAIDIPVTAKVKYANYIQRHFKNTVYLSLHVNAGPSDAMGPRVLHFPGSKRSKELANMLGRSMVNGTEFSDYKTVARAHLWELLATKSPAILGELFFMTNTYDLDYVQQNQGRYDISDAITSFIRTADMEVEE